MKKNPSLANHRRLTPPTNVASTTNKQQHSQGSGQSRQQKPLVSVIMALFNHEKYVAAAIESMLAQTYQHFELIIIDDGSTDMSANVARQYAKTDKRIIYYHQKNKGEYAARNRGLTMARGEYIAWLDADDIIYPTKLQTQVDFLEKNQAVAICAVGCERIDSRGHLLSQETTGPVTLPYKNNRHQPRNPLTGHSNHVVGATIMTRHGCYKKLGFYRPFELGTDYDMLLRMEEHFTIVVLPYYLYGWRLHANTSISRIKKNGYHGRLGISINRLVVNLSCLARRYHGVDPLMTMVGLPLDNIYFPSSNIALARPRVFFLFWRLPCLWFYIFPILRINKMSIPEFMARLLWAGMVQLSSKVIKKK